MDIAKIRKKAQQKSEEKKTDEKSAAAPAPEQKEEQPAVHDEKQRTPAAGKPASSLPVATAEPPREVIQAEKPGPSVPEKPDNPAEEQEDALVELLTFSLAREEFAVKVSEVEEIIKYQRITGVPTLPEYVSGITSLRGKIIPVIDLKTRLHLNVNSLASQPSGGDTGSDADRLNPDDKILIISGPEGFIGAIIDRVIGVVRLPHTSILQPPGHLSEAEMKFIEGVVILEKRFISIIRSQDAMKIELS